MFVLLTSTFLALTLGEFGSKAPDAGLAKVGGYLGLLTALAAWYASFAVVTDFTFKRSSRSCSRVRARRALKLTSRSTPDLKWH